MLEESRFAELYKKLVDRHFTPNRLCAQNALNAVLRQLSGSGTEQAGP